MSGLFSPRLFAGRTVLITGQGRWADSLGDAFGQGGASVASPRDIDWSDAAAVAEAFDAAEARFGPVDVLVTAPEVAFPRRAKEITLSDWRAVTGPGYDGVFLACAEFARRRLRARGRGWITNLISHPNGAGHAAEVATGAGVENLVKTLGAEWARDGIRVNGLISRDWSSVCTRSLTAMTLYLCSPYSGFVTASLLEVDPDD